MHFSSVTSKIFRNFRQLIKNKQISSHQYLENVQCFQLKYQLENERSTPGCLTEQPAIRSSLLRRLAPHW